MPRLVGIDDVDWITIGVLVTNNLNNVADQAAWARDAHALLTTIARLPDESDLYGALTQAETQLAPACITIERQTVHLLNAAAPPPQVAAVTGGARYCRDSGARCYHVAQAPGIGGAG